MSLYVDERGEGPAIVWIPGLGAEHSQYAPQLEAFTEYRNLAIDLRGCGQSPSLDGIPDDAILSTQADDIAELLRNKGIERAHIVGVSYGGVIAQEMLLRHPELVHTAVISDSFCTTRPRNLRERMQVWPAKLQPLSLRLSPLGLMAAGIGPVYRRWPDASRYLQQVLRTTDKNALIRQRKAINNVDLERQLRSVSTPTLCLVGDHTKMGVSMAQRLQAAIPRSRLSVIPDSFDPSNLCNPEVFGSLVRSWLAEHPTSQ